MCLLFVAGSGGPASRARCGAPHLFLWPLCLSALLGPLRAGVAPLSLAALAVPRCLGAVLWLFFSVSRCLAVRALAPRLCPPLAALWWFLPPPSLFVSRGFRRSCLVPWCCCFFFLLLSLCAPVVSGFLWFPAPGALGLGAVRCLLCWPSASRLSVRLSLFRAFRLAGRCSPPPPFFLAVLVAAARCCVPCAVRPWVRCCAALLRVVSSVDGSLNPVPLCDLDQVLLKEVMAENRGLTLSDLKNRSLEHLSATLTGCESPDGYLEPAAVKEDADDQLSEIASTIPPVDPSCVDLKHSAFLAQLLLEEVDLESTSEPTSPAGKPVLHMQPMHSGEPVARRLDSLAGPASNNMPLSEHDTQELRRLLYLKAEGIERQERLQYLRQTWKSSIWSEEYDDSYTLPDPEIPLVYSLHYRQQCPPEWDDGSVPAETADRQKRRNMERATSMLRRISCRKSRVLTLTPD